MLSGSEGLSDSEKVLKLQQLIRKLTDEQKQSKAKTAEELEEELKMKRMNLMMEEVSVCIWLFKERSFFSMFLGFLAFMSLQMSTKNDIAFYVTSQE